MIRATLIIAAAVALAGLAWIAGEWARLHFVPPPTPVEVPADAFVQHPGYETMAWKAIQAFEAMPTSRQRALRANLRRSLADLDTELARLARSRLTILCIGEHHIASTRQFLAGTVVPALGLDVLLLETPDEELPSIMRQIDAGAAQVPLLGVDIAAVIRAARSANPDIVIAGIDESASQKTQRIQRNRGSRDLAIAGNLRSNLRRGKLHGVLFGALHCADQPNWMYRRILLGEHRVKREEIVNVNVIGEHQDGTLEAFLAFIDAIGIKRRNFMIADTSALDRLIFTWFPAFTRSFLRFDAVIVFQEHTHAHTLARPDEAMGAADCSTPECPLPNTQAPILEPRRQAGGAQREGTARPSS